MSRIGTRAGPPPQTRCRPRSGPRVDVSAGNHNELGERSVERESRLLLLRTDLSVSSHAGGTLAAAAHERCRHAVPDREASHFGTDGDDGPGELVTGRVRDDVAVVPPPGVKVTSAQPGRPDPDEHVERGRLGNRQVDENWRRAERGHAHCTHRRRHARSSRVRPRASCRRRPAARRSPRATRGR